MLCYLHASIPVCLPILSSIFEAVRHESFSSIFVISESHMSLTHCQKSRIIYTSIHHSHQNKDKHDIHTQNYTPTHTPPFHYPDWSINNIQPFYPPRRTMSNTHDFTTCNSPATCPICLDSMSPSSISTSRCGHVFHVTCLSLWRSQRFAQTCPICRAALHSQHPHSIISLLHSPYPFLSITSTTRLFPSRSRFPSQRVHAHALPRARSARTDIPRPAHVVLTAAWPFWPLAPPLPATSACPVIRPSGSVQRRMGRHVNNSLAFLPSSANRMNRSVQNSVQTVHTQGDDMNSIPAYCQLCRISCPPARNSRTRCWDAVLCQMVLCTTCRTFVHSVLSYWRSVA